MSKQQIQRGELICTRGCITPIQFVQNLAKVEKIRTTDTCVELHLVNVLHQTTVVKQSLDVDLHPAWFRVCLPGKKLAPYEISVVSYILHNPGCTPAMINANVYSKGGLKDAKAAITRICNKGFTMIRNYIIENGL